MTPKTTVTEFIVPGIPISAQASPRSKQRWKAEVAASAREVLPASHALVADPVRVTIVYFYVVTDLDLDNILKPILDALEDVIYVKDSQVTNISAAKRDLTGTFVLEGASPVIIEQLVATANSPRDFVFIAVELVNQTIIL